MPVTLSHPEAIRFYNEGCTAMISGRFADAASAFRQSLVVQPGTLMVEFNLAMALQQSGDLAGAVAAFRVCVADHPDHAMSSYSLGGVLKQAGDLAGAVAAYRACLACDPDHRDGAFNLAASLQGMGDREGAVSAYRACLARHPNDRDCAYNLACLLQSSRDFVDAIALYRDCLARYPDHRDSAFNLAGCLQEAGDRRAALAAYRACIARHPEDGDAAVNLASLLRNQDDLAGAAVLYRQVLAHHPDRRDATFGLASCLQRLGDVDGAIALYQRCVTLDPSHPDAVDNLGNLYISLGRYAEAIAILEPFFHRHPEHGDFAQNLALAKWRARFATARNEATSDARILIASLPQSGSDFLAEVLGHLPGMQRADLVPGFGRREQELDLELLAQQADGPYVSALHVKPSGHTLEMLQAFAIRPLFLYRNIWEVMAGLHGRLLRESPECSMAQVDPGFRAWDEERQYLFLAQAMMPWFIDCYVAWMRIPDLLTLSYDRLMKDPTGTAAEIARWAGLAASVEEIARAVAAVAQDIDGRTIDAASVPEAARIHVRALADFYPDVDFGPLMGTERAR